MAGKRLAAGTGGHSPMEVFETEWSLSDLLCLNVDLVVGGRGYTEDKDRHRPAY